MTLPALLWTNLGALERAYSEQPHVVHVLSLDLWAKLLRVLPDTEMDSKHLPVSSTLKTGGRICGTCYDEDDGEITVMAGECSDALLSMT